MGELEIAHKVDKGTAERAAGQRSDVAVFAKAWKVSRQCLDPREIAVDALKDRAKSLEPEVQRQRQVDEQAGQLKVLVTFVHSSLRDHIEGRTERAAIRVFERLASMQGDESRQAQTEMPPAKKR